MKMSRRVVGLSVALGLGAVAAATQGPDQTRQGREVVSAEQVATMVGTADRLLIRHSATSGPQGRRPSVDEVERQILSRVPELSTNPVSQEAVRRRVTTVSQMADRLTTGDRVVVTATSASLHDVEQRIGFRLVRVHLKRSVKDGPVWEEVAPFAVIDRTHDGLRQGDIVALDREAMDAGEVPAVLKDAAGRQ